MKERFQNILSMGVKRRGVIVFLVVLVSITLIGGMVACNIISTNSTISDAEIVVAEYLEAKKDNNFVTWKSTLWSADDGQSSISSFEKEGDLGVISLTIDKVEVSYEETKRIKEQYAGSDLAQKYKWSDEYIAENMIAVFAQYTVDYDNTKVPYGEGNISQYFYLIRADKDSTWYIWEQNYDVSN